MSHKHKLHHYYLRVHKSGPLQRVVGGCCGVVRRVRVPWSYGRDVVVATLVMVVIIVKVQVRVVIGGALTACGYCEFHRLQGTRVNSG